MKDKKLPPNETNHNDLTGFASVIFKDKEDFNSFCRDIALYDLNRFEAVAVRVFIENNPVVTVYALDKENTQPISDGKIPVRKFKKEVPLEELFNRFKQINFTLSDGEYDIEDMEVMNK